MDLESVRAQMARVRSRIGEETNQQPTLTELREERKSANYKVKKLRSRLDEVQSKIDSLEKGFLQRTFLSIGGIREKRIQEYREQSRVISSDLEEWTEELCGVEEQIGNIEQQIESNDESEREYQELLSLKRGLLLSSSTVFKAELDSIEKEKEGVLAELTVLQDTLRLSREMLRHAGYSRSTWKKVTLISDSINTSIIGDIQKSSLIDEAKHVHRKTQKLLPEYKVQLEKLGLVADLEVFDIDMGGFTLFAATFLDSKFAAMRIDEQARTYTRQTARLQSRLRSSVLKLQERTHALEQHLEALAGKEISLVEQS